MGNGISTGSLLNQRVFNRNGGAGSSTKGGGVQKNSLTQTRITLANRNRGTAGRSSYTALSNSINGRKEVIYVGGGSKCSGTPSMNMSTMDKIAAWTAIAQQGVQFGQGLANLFGAGKADKTPDTKGTGTAKGTGGAGNPPEVKPNNTPNVKQNMATTLAELTSGGDVISDMDSATCSKDLLSAINNAKSYKASLAVRISSAQTLSNNAKAELEKMDNLDIMDKAEKDLKDAETSVSSNKQAINSTKNRLQQHETEYKDAQNALKGKNAEYDKLTGQIQEQQGVVKNAKVDVDENRQKLSDAKANVQTATTNAEVAQRTLSAAAARCGTLEAALATANAETRPFIQEQYDAAYKEMQAAQKAKEEADTALQDAKDKQKVAQDVLDSSTEIYNGEKGKLSDMQKNEKAMLQELKKQDANTKKLAEQVESSKDNMDKQEKLLEHAEKQYDTALENQARADEALKDLKNRKAECEAIVKDFEKLQKENNKLGDEISDAEKRLDKMYNKEKNEEVKLTQKRDKQQTNFDTRNGNVNLTDGLQRGQETRDFKSAQRASGKVASYNDKLTDNIAGQIEDPQTQFEMGMKRLKNGKSAIFGQTKVEMDNGKFYQVTGDVKKEISEQDIKKFVGL